MFKEGLFNRSSKRASEPVDKNKQARSFVDHITTQAIQNSTIPPEYYGEYNIKRGLRNSNGTGVLVGITEVGSVHGYKMTDGEKEPDHGNLFYRGIDIHDLVKGFQNDDRRGYEETAFLLLFGQLPTDEELKTFNELLDTLRNLPDGYTENMILKIPSKDIMNKLMRSVLVLYSHDNNPEDLSVSNLLLQSINLIAKFPTIISYGYQAKSHYYDHNSLFIHAPKPGVGTAENILHMIRPDCTYTKTEAEVLDLCMVIHAEHGGGNNSSFATHVVSSSGTDTYSAIAAAIGSLKGPKHGGANIMVKKMIEDIKSNVIDYTDEASLKSYLNDILDKEVFDGQGLVYGMGHAVYTLSDPRAVLLKQKAYELALEKDMVEKFNLYANIEKLTTELLQERKGQDFIISANVDLYAGLVYEMLNIPKDLYTPIFAASRISGWCAHRIEQIISDPKILRPAYKSVNPKKAYTPISERTT